MMSSQFNRNSLLELSIPLRLKILKWCQCQVLIVGKSCSAENLGMYAIRLDASRIFGCTHAVISHIVYNISGFFTVRKVPDLSKKYDTNWTLVTGADTGIGRAINCKLVSQGLNVGVLSLDDNYLKVTMKDLRKTYLEQTFRSVGVMLGPWISYLDIIKQEMEDIDVQCIFNNAGFIDTAFPDQSPINKILANIEYNSTAAVNITHHFVGKISKKYGWYKIIRKITNRKYYSSL